METAKICWTGRSQAIHLPKKYCIDGDEVRIGMALRSYWNRFQLIGHDWMLY